MAIEQSGLWKFSCDVCHRSQTFAVAPANGRPARWHKTTDEYDEFDEFGNSLRVYTKRLLVCDECADKTIKHETTTPQMARLASQYLNITDEEFAEKEPEALLDDLRSLAGSVLSQSVEVNNG